MGVTEGLAEEAFVRCRDRRAGGVRGSGAGGRNRAGGNGGVRYRKRLPDGVLVECEVDVFALRVAKVLDDWPERTQRRRQWFTFAEAAALVEEEDLAALLLRLATD